METISIKPVDGRGWVVECSGTANAQMFASGAKAEMSARDLAHRFARAGTSSRITLYLRDGSVAGQVATTIEGRGRSWGVTAPPRRRSLVNEFIPNPCRYGDRLPPFGQ